MHPMNVQNPGLMNVASTSQNMATHSKQEKMAVAFQTIAMVSMAIMGATAAAHLIRDMLRSQTPGKGR